MKSITTLDVVALTLAATRLGVTLAYYFYIESEYLNKPFSEISINGVKGLSYGAL